MDLMTTPEDRVVWEADEEALYRSAHEAARGATESDATGSRVVGEGSDAQKAREAAGARLARYAEAVHGVFEAAAQPSRYAEPIARAVMAVADAELEQARAEVRAEAVERWRESHTIETARLREARERATAAESALTEAREQLSRLREAVEGVADKWEAWTPGSMPAPSVTVAAYERGISACTEDLRALLADVTPTAGDDPAGQEAEER